MRNAERHAELARAYRARNREKTKAQNRLNYAVRKGLMVRGSCEKCGTDQKVHAHHDDYSQPLQVHWLCHLCHRRSHPVDDEAKRIKVSDPRPRPQQYGESNPNCRLGAEDVRMIRKMLEMGLSQSKVGMAFGVSQVHIGRIQRGAAQTKTV